MEHVEDLRSEHEHEHEHGGGHGHAADGRQGLRRWAFGPVVLAVPLGLAALSRGRMPWVDGDDVRLWSTLFVSVCIQALPFLVLGVVLSGLIAAYVSPDLVQRVVPRRSLLAVPVAGVAGVALPGCECGSVPIAGSLIAAGTPPAAALTFLLAAPAINPVVLTATAVAFPNDHRMVVARLVASFVTAVAVGSWWARRGDSTLLASLRHAGHDDGDVTARWRRAVDAASRDLVHAGGWLVVGAMAAATIQLLVPRTVLDAVAGNEALAVAALAALAVLLSICSEADAFVMVGLPQFSLTSRLVFLVVGPVIDLKLIAMQSGILGRAFTARFAPLCFTTAVLSAVVVGRVIL